MLSLKYEHRHLVGSSDYDDTLEQWTVSVVEWDEGDDDGPQVGELTLFRLRDYTGFSRIEAADGYSGELLSIVEAVLDEDEYSEEFEEAIETPVGDLLILDRMYLDKSYRGFGLGPVFAAEAVRRLSGGCCAVAVEPGMSEWPGGDPSSVSDAENDAATAKITALWESIGFRHFKDGVYLLDTALDYRDLLARHRKELAAFGEEYRNAHR
ncbi:hypothetical protein [Streptomyces mirabilis]